MESSSLWAPIYRRFRISGISYRYIRMHGEKAPTSPKSYRRWVSDQSPVWMGQVFKLKANFPLLKEGPGGEKGEVGSSNWIRRRYELRYLEMEMYQCGRDSSSSASSTAASLSLSLSLLPRRTKKKKEKENSALRIEYIGYMEYKQEWISFGGFWKRGWSGGWRSGLINQAVDFMVSPLFFIREVCLFVAKLVQNSFFFFIVQNAWRNGKIRAIKRN